MLESFWKNVQHSEVTYHHAFIQQPFIKSAYRDSDNCKLFQLWSRVNFHTIYCKISSALDNLSRQTACTYLIVIFLKRQEVRIWKYVSSIHVIQNSWEIVCAINIWEITCIYMKTRYKTLLSTRAVIKTTILWGATNILLSTMKA